MSVGVASVLIGLTFMGASSVSADTNTQSDAANQPAVVNTDKGTQSDNHATTNQPVSENNAAAAKDTNTQAAANNNQTANQATANVTPAAENNNSQAAETKAPDYYNITVNFHDVTRGGNIQVLNKMTGLYEYKSDYKGPVVYPGATTAQNFKAPVAGCQLLNPEILDQYFDFDANGYALMKKGVLTPETRVLENGMVEGKINLTLNYGVLSPIKVQYVDTDNGHVLASMELPSYYMSTVSPERLAGDPKAPDASKYEGAVINVPGYKLVSAPLIEGKIDGQTQNSLQDKNYIYLTFQYKKVMDNAESATTTPGKGSAGAVISANNWINLPGIFTINGVYGLKNSADNGDVEKRTQDLIDCYKKQGFSYIGTTNKIFNDDYYNYYATWTKIYLISNQAVQVNYVDEQGNKLADSDTLATNAANPDQTNQGINSAAYWNPAGEWTAKPKDIQGYHLVKTEGATNGEYTAYQYVTTFVYAKDQGNVIVTVHDVTDNKDLDNYAYNTGDQDVNTPVSYDKATTISELQKAGYKVLNADEVVVSSSIVKGTQKVTINVEHDTVTVTPDKPATPSDPVNPSVPDGPKFPAGTYADQLNHTYTRTINYLDSKTNEPVATSVVQPVKASRTALVDKVTGQLKGYVDAQGNLLTGDGWTAVASPKVSGYQNPEITEVAAAKVNPNDPSSNQTVNVYYTPEIIDPNDPTPDHPTDPTTPENPTTPTTSANPGTPGVVPGTSQPGQSVVPTQTGKQVTPAKDSHNAQQLPQTGNNNQAAVLGLGMGAVASLLGFLGLNKKREN